MNREENRRQDWEILENAGLHCHISFPVTLPQTMDVVRQIGALLQRADTAAAITAGIARSRETVRGRRHERAALTWAYLIWRKPWMAVSRQTYIHELISEAGGINIFAGASSPYPVISADQLAAADPQRVLLSSEPFPFKEKHIRELVEATGLPASRFEIVDGELLSGHCAFTEQGLLYADRIFSAMS